MNKPNPLKKLLVNDEKEYFLFLTEYEKDVLSYSVHIFKSLLEQKGDRDFEKIEYLERKILIANNFNNKTLQR
jgi:hypothetical protein